MRHEQEHNQPNPPDNLASTPHVFEYSQDADRDNLAWLSALSTPDGAAQAFVVYLDFEHVQPQGWHDSVVARLLGLELGSLLHTRLADLRRASPELFREQ